MNRAIRFLHAVLATSLLLVTEARAAQAWKSQLGRASAELAGNPGTLLTHDIRSESSQNKGEQVHEIQIGLAGAKSRPAPLLARLKESWTDFESPTLRLQLRSSPGQPETRRNRGTLNIKGRNLPVEVQKLETGPDVPHSLSPGRKQKHLQATVTFEDDAGAAPSKRQTWKLTLDLWLEN